MAGLPSAQLEIAALAFAISSIVTYALLWNRPQNFAHRYRIVASRLPTPEEVAKLALDGPTFMWTWFRFRPQRDLNFLPIPNDADHTDFSALLAILPRMNEYVRGRRWTAMTSESSIKVLGSAFGGAVFGGVHCLAWNFDFPSVTEAILWRICSVATTTISLASFHSMRKWADFSSQRLLGEGSNPHMPPSRLEIRVHAVILLALSVPYNLARVFLMVEIVRTLFYLPPDAFRDGWWVSLPRLR